MRVNTAFVMQSGRLGGGGLGGGIDVNVNFLLFLFAALLSKEQRAK